MSRARSPIEATQVSLPSGPASIEGLGSSFAPSLASGTAAYSVDIALPPSAGGFGPHLALAYDSGGGVSELGMGWRLSGLPRVRRSTENGLPRFTRDDPLALDGVGVACDLLQVSSGVFRPEYESGAFVRVEQAGANTWEMRDKAGTTWRLGGAGYEEADGANVATYLPSQALDLHGHAIAFEWDTSSGYAVLQRAVWNDYGDSARNEVVVSYEARPDAHVLFGNGIRQFLAQRLTAIDVRHGGRLVRRYVLTYGQDIHSRLASVTLLGRDGTSALPTLSFAYTAQTFAPKLVAMTNPPGRSPSDPDVEISDLDGDGLPDLLVTGGATGQYRSYLNQDGTAWKKGTDWPASQSPSASLASVGVQLADLDGDGAIDLVVKSGSNDFRYFPGRDATSFGAPVAIATVPGFSFEDPDVKLADMDGDRRIDAVITTVDGLAIAYNLNGLDWSVPRLLAPIDSRQSLRFSDGGHTQLCEINGDRVEDLCYLTSGSLVYWLGRGRGVFEPAQTASRVPTWDASSPWELHDLNGDGWVDLVHVGVGEVDVALAHAAGQFDAPLPIRSVPTRDSNTVIRFADMNASGTTDIVWIDPAADPSKSWQYLELFPAGRAGLLQRIDNGLGKVATVMYAPAAVSAAAARSAGTAWSTRINVAMPVVSEVDVDDSLGDPVMVSRYTYANGTWSPIERTFAGFGGGTETNLGDTFTPTLVTTRTFDLGLVDREMRGAELTAQTSDASGAIFSRTTDTWTTEPIDRGVDGRSVDYSYRATERMDYAEGAEPSMTRSTLTEWQQDTYGNVIRESRWGEIVGDNKLAGHDEAITIRTYANNTVDWILGRPATEELTDAAGNRVAMRRLYYDGPSFVGLPLGQLARGDLTRQEAWAGPDADAFELDTATRYDSDGHPLETRDSRGGGHLFVWDTRDHTTLLEERVKLESSLLSETFGVDRAFGNVTSATGYDGQTTTYAYDPFGRLTSVVRPGDFDSAPTVRYGYVVSPPLSRVLIDKRVAVDADEHSEELIDGLGRKRGTLAQDEGTRWVLAGVSLLDARGQGRRALRARFASQTDHDMPPLLTDAPGVNAWRDSLGRTVRTRTTLGIETRTAFGPFVVSVWDGAQNDPTSPYEHTPVVSAMDGLGRLVQTTYTFGGQPYASTYSYDAAGALVSKTDAEGNVSRYAYDGRGRRTLVDDPDAGKHRFTYDATGNLTEHDKPDGTVARFAFDLGGRPISEDWDGDGKAEVVHSWDRSETHPGDPLYAGKLVMMLDASGSTENEYDARGRVTAVHHTIDGHSYSVGSVYDDQDREVLHVFPDQSSVRIHYNPRGQLAGYGQALAIAYDGDGLELRRAFNTGVVEQTNYDADRRRTEKRAVATDGHLVQDLVWTYDGAGNITAVADKRPNIDVFHDRSESYRFDNLYRLRGASGTWGTASWKYSASGNLVERSSTVAALNAGTLTYGAAAGPHALTGFAGRVLSYDVRGRLVGDGDRAFTWNADDQLTRVQAADGASVDSIADGAGERRARRDHGSNGEGHTTYFLDPWTEVHDGQLVRFLVHGGSRVAQLAPTTGTLDTAATSTATFLDRDECPRSTGTRRALPRFAATCGLALALLATFLARRRGRWALSVWRVSRPMGAVTLVALLSCNGSAPETTNLRGTIRSLGSNDTLLLDDAIGTLTEQTSGDGTSQAQFSAFPYGVTRFDSSPQTHKYANTPRDRSIGLDIMGARAYAPDLGIWTRADPISVEDPTRSVGSPLGASNPYSYAGQTPTVASDEHGQWWHIVAAAAVGAAIGGATEAYRQYAETGHVGNWGRVANHAAATSAAFGLVAALPSPSTVAEAVAMAGAGNALAGMAGRLVDTGGKSAGTAGQVAADYAEGAASSGVAIGVAKVFRNVASAIVATGASGVARATAAAAGPQRLASISLSYDGYGNWAKVPGDPRAFARVVQHGDALHVTDVFAGSQPPGTGSRLIAAALKASGVQPGQNVVFTKISNAETLAMFREGGDPEGSLLGRTGAKALNELGLEASDFEFQTAGKTVNLAMRVK